MKMLTKYVDGWFDTCHTRSKPKRFAVLNYEGYVHGNTGPFLTAHQVYWVNHKISNNMKSDFSSTDTAHGVKVAFIFV